MSDLDRYSANSYTRGGLGHRSTVEAARRLLNGDAGYVFDTKLHRTEWSSQWETEECE